MLTANFSNQSTNSNDEVIMPTLIELIDSYIEMNVEYDDAYLYAIEDLQRELATERQADAEWVEPIEVQPLTEEQQANDDELFVAQAVRRGFAPAEARLIVKQARKLTAEGNYAKAYTMYLSRLMS